MLMYPTFKRSFFPRLAVRPVQSSRKFFITFVLGNGDSKDFQREKLLVAPKIYIENCKRMSI